MENRISLASYGPITIAASGVWVSPAINMELMQPSGFDSLQVLLTDDGTALIEILGSNRKLGQDADFFKPSGTADIVTAFTKTSGEDSDGNDIISFSRPVLGWMKFRITETGTADQIIVTLDWAGV